MSFLILLSGRDLRADSVSRLYKGIESFALPYGRYEVLESTFVKRFGPGCAVLHRDGWTSRVYYQARTHLWMEFDFTQDGGSYYPAVYQVTVSALPMSAPPVPARVEIKIPPALTDRLGFSIAKLKKSLPALRWNAPTRTAAEELPSLRGATEIELTPAISQNVVTPASFFFHRGRLVALQVHTP